jgi:hypothetical protein
MAIQKEGVGDNINIFRLKDKLPYLTVTNFEKKMLFNNWYCSCQAIHVQENVGNLQGVSLSSISTSVFQPMDGV